MSFGSPSSHRGLDGWTVDQVNRQASIAVGCIRSNLGQSRARCLGLRINPMVTSAQALLTSWTWVVRIATCKWNLFSHCVLTHRVFCEWSSYWRYWHSKNQYSLQMCRRWSCHKGSKSCCKHYPLCRRKNCSFVILQLNRLGLFLLTCINRRNVFRQESNWQKCTEEHNSPSKYMWAWRRLCISIYLLFLITIMLFH